MSKTFELKDDSVVVVIGSGAGGGTLSNELTQRGASVVCLEAGPRLTLTDIVNDNATMFGRLSWLDKRIGTGDLNAGLPLWVCKTVGGTTVHWAGASLRFQDHEFRTRTVYGDIPGANLLDWPITLQELEPYYAGAEDKMGVTGTHSIPRLPGNNNFKVMAAGAKRVGYKEVHPETWLSTLRTGMVVQLAIRSASACRVAPSAPNGQRSTRRFQRQRALANSRSGRRAWWSRSITMIAAE